MSVNVPAAQSLDSPINGAILGGLLERVRHYGLEMGVVH